MAEFTVFEKDLSEASGVARSIFVKKRRELVDGVDFAQVKNATAYTSDAALAVLVALGVTSPANALERACRGLADGSEKNGAQLVGVVTRLFRPNTRAMECRLEKNGALVTVSVRDNLMFYVGQRVPLKKSLTDIHFLDAPHPRRKGKIPGFEEAAQ